MQDSLRCDVGPVYSGAKQRRAGTTIGDSGAVIVRWRHTELTKRAEAQSHFLDLYELLGEPKPTDVGSRSEQYCFEKAATKTTGSKAWANVFKRGRFMTKTGIGMTKAHFSTPIEQCDVNDKGALCVYRHKRVEWLNWLLGEDDHSSARQIGL